jgi:hypothetical protein
MNILDGGKNKMKIDHIILALSDLELGLSLQNHVYKNQYMHVSIHKFVLQTRPDVFIL